MTRDEFKQYAINYLGQDRVGILEDEQPFWIPEVREGWKASYFIALPWMDDSKFGNNEDFWEWNRTHLSKPPQCFMVSKEKQIEWWGFNNEQDATMFILRWF